MRLACIGIGSNAIRLLVADVQGGVLHAVRRERRGTRLYAGLVGGMLTQQSMTASVNALAELAGLARGDDAQAVFVFATSAVRDAANAGEFTERCEAAAGTRVEVITGEQEAVLSYMGASEGGRCGVVDIGGGSTEYTLGDEGQVLGAVSLQLGAVRMHACRPVLSLEAYEETVEQCIQVIRRDAQALLALPPCENWAGVGGTMTTLGAMQRGVPLFDPVSCEGMYMTREEIAAWGRRLAAMPMEARRQVTGLMPHRADIMPSGMAILEASLRCFGVKRLRLSAHGNMDGYLKKKIMEMA